MFLAFSFLSLLDEAIVKDCLLENALRWAVWVLEGRLSTLLEYYPHPSIHPSKPEEIKASTFIFPQLAHIQSSYLVFNLQKSFSTFFSRRTNFFVLLCWRLWNCFPFSLATTTFSWSNYCEWHFKCLWFQFISALCLLRSSHRLKAQARRNLSTEMICISTQSALHCIGLFVRLMKDSLFRCMRPSRRVVASEIAPLRRASTRRPHSD